MPNKIYTHHVEFGFDAEPGKPEPVKEAVALSYEAEKGVPVVAAAGSGKVAEQILEAAQAAHVPIHRDPHLAHALNLLNIGDEIPRELYEVAAQILIYVAKIDERNMNPPSA